MILNNFAAIIAKRKDLKPVFKIFIKPFQQQLIFIEEILSLDAQEMQGKANCCYCLIKRFKCFRKKVANQYELFNPVFYRVFSEMIPVKRQEYFIELLSVIEGLGEAYENYQQGKFNIGEDMDASKYRSHITTMLVDKFISKEIFKELDQEEEEQVCLDLLVEVDGVRSQKVGRFKNFKYELIEKLHGIETKIVINLKNYLIVNANKQELSLEISTIYQTIVPLNIKFSFAQEQSKKYFEKYLRILSEITKTGQIQKLVRNIDLVKVLGKDYDEKARAKKLANNSLMKTFVKQELQEPIQSLEEKNYVDSEDIIRSSMANKIFNMRRLQTIREGHYQQTKKRLIETLVFLAQKKQKINQRVQQFLKKEPIYQPKQKSQAIQRVLTSTQAFVSRKQAYEKKQHIEFMPRQIFNFVSSPQFQFQKLSIINRNYENIKQNGRDNGNESGFINSVDGISETSDKFKKLFNISQENGSKKIIYHQNMYNKLYGQEFKFNRVESLMEMIKVEFKDLYIIPEEALKRQSNQLIGDKFSKFKANWLDKFLKVVRVYCRKPTPSFVKVFIPLSIQLKAIVEGLVNVQAYRYWHPNIENVQIITSISAENAIVYRMDALNPITNKSYSILMLMHIFRLDGKYYLLQKKMKNQENLGNDQKERGILSFFNKKKPSESFSNLEFLMMRISNTNRDGFCQMIISFDYSPIQSKNDSNARRQLMTFFLNFVFIVNYWKLSPSEKKFNPGIFNYDWTVSTQSFDQDEMAKIKHAESVYFDNINLRASKLQRDQQKLNVESSSELIHSSQFYDA